MFRLITLFALLSSTAALQSNSEAGQRLLSQSRALEEDAYDWMMSYSLVFQSCHLVHTYAGGEEGGEDGQTVQYTKLVKYKLCPSKKCGYGCKGAEYVTSLNTFVDSYTEWKMNDVEYKCEQIREKCNCNYYYGDDQACENQCYSEAGMTECIEEQKDDDAYEFDLQDWMECSESEAYDTYGNKLYVGPTCSANGEQINMGVFTDQYCLEPYASEVFASFYGGTTLPYQDSNIVAENCIECKLVEAQGNGYYGESVTPICEESYPASAKCETNLAKYLQYPVTAGCDYINNIKFYEKNYHAVSGAASTFFAVVFGLSTIVLAGVAVHLYRMNSRKIELHTDAAVV